MQYPAELRYTKDHEWARETEDGVIRIGITTFAVEQLGDVTLIDLPEVGTDVESNETFGDIESVKTVSELFAPVSGEVVARNDELEGSPELVNEGPYGAGWLVDIKPSDPGEFGRLMDAGAYEDFLSKIE